MQEALRSKAALQQLRIMGRFIGRGIKLYLPVRYYLLVEDLFKNLQSDESGKALLSSS